MTEKNRQKAHFLQDLRLLIGGDYFFFRAKITFTDRTELCCYGDEHSVTYKQCLHGYATEIQLDATKGYTALLNYIELNGKEGNIKIAKLFGRNNLSDRFSTQHRIYSRGKWQQINDPVIPVEHNNRILDFIVEKGRVEIAGLREKELPDFKTEISKALATEEKAKTPNDSMIKEIEKTLEKDSVAKAIKKQDHSIY